MTIDFIPILIIMLVELLIYFVEIFLAVRSKDNKQLREANIAGECEFLDLQEGYRTGLSYFRTSMFIAYVIAVIMFIDTSQGKQTLDEILLFIVFGILIYMVTLMNQRIFIFHTSYFIIGAPFHFFKRDAIIRYEEIEDFRLYRALYSSYFLRIRFKNGTEKLYQFSGSFLPRNDLVLKITLNSVTGLNKDFRKLRRKSIRTDFIDDDEN